MSNTITIILPWGDNPPLAPVRGFPGDPAVAERLREARRLGEYRAMLRAAQEAAEAIASAHAGG